MTKSPRPCGPFVFNLSLLVVVVCSSMQTSLRGQGPLAESIDSFLQQARVIRAYGISANRPLRTMGREDSALALAIIKLRRQATKSKTPKTADSKEVLAACTKWVGMSRVLLRFGVSISPLLNQKAAAASALDQELLRALDRCVFIARAKLEIKKFSGKGTYQGMFEPLRPHAKEISQAFLFVLSDRLENPLIRAYAAEGLAQLCPKALMKDVRTRVAALYHDRDEAESMKKMAMVVLARLGDAKILDNKLAEYKRIIDAELGKKSNAERSYTQLLLAYEKLGDLLQLAGRIESASQVNSAYLRLVFQLCTYESQSEEARNNIAAQCYDFSCQLAQLRKIDFGLHILDYAFSWGLKAFAWAKEDKELANLRRDPRFEPLLLKWESGKAKPGSLKYDDSLYQKLAPQPAATSKRKPTTQSTSRPSSSK